MKRFANNTPVLMIVVDDSRRFCGTAGHWAIEDCIHCTRGGSENTMDDEQLEIYL